MNDQPGFFSRLGSFFRGGGSSGGGSKATAELPIDSNGITEGENGTTAGPGSNGAAGQLFHPVEAARSTFLRPWAKRDAAIVQLQEGFTTLTGLMGAVKESLEKQNQRQDELIQVLGGLPEVLRSIPASGAAQTETLKAIATQIKDQNAQHQKLGQILEKVSEAEGNQREILDSLKQRVETLGDHDRTIAASLNNVGSAMETVSRTSHTSAQVLEQMRDNINSREGELQRLMHKQGSRYTTMLAIAIFLSVAALAAVCVIGYLLITRPH
jgi:hypothetical protein